MTGIQHFVSSVQKLSQDGQLGSLVEYLKKAMVDVLPRNLNNLDNVLETLNLQLHSIAITSILLTKLQNIHEAADLETFTLQADEFFTGCNSEHVREASSLFCELCHQLTAALVKKNMSRQGIPLLLKALRRLQAHPSQLTQIHADVCQLCLHAKILKPALPLLEADVTEIMKELPTHATGSSGSAEGNSKYFLLYYYYGGMIYAILKRSAEALCFFEIALTTPCTAVSQIMVEAYKKFILVSLIQNGKVAPLPRYHPTMVSRFIRPICQPYLELEGKFNANDIGALRSHINSVRNAFEADNNMGLVRQVENSLTRRSIQRLTKTFLTLSLSDVAARCGLLSADEALMHVRDMIRDGEIFASINEQDGMVEFEDNPEDYASLATLNAIEARLGKAMHLESALLRRMDRETMLSQEYVKKISKASSAAGPSSGFPEDEGLGFSSRDFGMFDAP